MTPPSRSLHFVAPRDIKETYSEGRGKVTGVCRTRDRRAESESGLIIRREENQKSRSMRAGGRRGKETADAPEDRREDRARGGGADTARCLREPINHSTRIKGSKDEKRRRTVGRTAGRNAEQTLERVDRRDREAESENEGRRRGGEKERYLFSFTSSASSLVSAHARERESAGSFFIFVLFEIRRTPPLSGPAETSRDRPPPPPPPPLVAPSVVPSQGPDSLTDSTIPPARLRFLTISVRSADSEE